jgi:N-acyl-D-aspartate/D-glutamate deacylase
VNLLSARNAAVGMNDRGALTAGLRADLNVIDMDRLAIHSPIVLKDLPAGGRRFNFHRVRGLVVVAK